MLIDQSSDKLNAVSHEPYLLGLLQILLPAVLWLFHANLYPVKDYVYVAFKTELANDPDGFSAFLRCFGNFT